MVGRGTFVPRGAPCAHEEGPCPWALGMPVLAPICSPYCHHLPGQPGSGRSRCHSHLVFHLCFKDRLCRAGGWPRSEPPPLRSSGQTGRLAFPQSGRARQRPDTGHPTWESAAFTTRNQTWIQPGRNWGRQVGGGSSYVSPAHLGPRTISLVPNPLLKTCHDNGFENVQAMENFLHNRPKLTSEKKKI